MLALAVAFLDNLSKGVALLISLKGAKDAGIQIRFDRVYEPWFPLLEDMHKNYSAMFAAARQDAVRDGWQSICGLSDRRLEKATARRQVVIETHAFLAQDGLHAFEIGFLEAVSDYLSVNRERVVDSYIPSIPMTPAGMLINALSVAEDPDVQVVFIETAIDDRQKRWEEISAAYAKLRAHVFTLS